MWFNFETMHSPETIYPTSAKETTMTPPSFLPTPDPPVQVLGVATAPMGLLLPLMAVPAGRGPK